LPSRRDRTKAEAIRTPFADLAPALPARDERAPADEPDVAQVIPDDDMLAESTATMPAPIPETDTAPANARSRPGARKVGARSDIPTVPRTIAEMQTGTYHTVEYDADAVAEVEEEEREREAPPLFISPRALVLTTLVPYAILALIPAMLFAICRAAHVSATISFVTFFIALAVGSVVALAMLLRNWRVAFHDAPDDLRPSSILMLWEERARGPRPDGWRTGSLAIIGIFLLLFLLQIVTVLVSAGITATYLIPFQLLLLTTKVIGAFLFYGYLQRGLSSMMSEARAAVISGLALGISAGIVSGITYAAVATGASAQNVLSFAGIVLVVALVGAWIRLRSRALYPAVAFYLLLLGFSPY
jgi:hypothetical protein